MDDDLTFDGPDAPEGDAFFDPPEDLSGGAVGDAIYLRPLDNPEAELTHGRNWLVLYRSNSVDGEVIAVSGIIALPHDRPTDPAGYPLVTWAHGTVGVCHLCAPSRDTVDRGAHLMNKYPQPLLNHFLDQGWAVAMTDYEGLGVTGRRHPYLLGRSEAYGVLDIVETTRRLFPEVISPKFAIVGHSQGGQAALFSAHHAKDRVEGLVGVAAVAPANHPKAIVRAGALVPTFGDGGFAFTPLFLSGAIIGDTTIGVDNVLSNKARGVWPDVLSMCRADLSKDESWGGVRGIEQFRKTLPGAQPAYSFPGNPNDDQQRFVDQLELMNPNVEIDVPIRISQSADDVRVKAETTEVDLLGIKIIIPGVDVLANEELVATNTDNKPLYVRYPKGDVQIPNPDPGDLGAHFATLTHDRDDLTGWVGDRFRD
ncbi:alpha/beta hydrolase family protein [Nocardia altamirensis]|uniref:alpha/beta hydrolase family protein n=1 Tax=Nocardia altamirensis TaxID=472158 RepID=UPI00084059D2|nr:alpha/beta fold hydrolase [Nocardia altamirensis]